MTKTTTLFFTAIIILFTMYSCQSTSEKEITKKASTIDTILERGYINVGTSGEQFPFSFKDESGNLQGIDIELSKKLAEEIGVDVKFVETDIDKFIPQLLQKNYDIILSGFSITSKRNTKVLFTNSYYQTGKAILTRVPEIKSGNKEFINNEAVTLVAILNSSSLDYTKENYPNATIITGETINDCQEILFSGKADGFISDYEICENLFFSNQNNGDYSFKNLGTASDHEYIGAAVNSDDFLFFNLVDNFIKKIDKRTQEEQIEESWLKYAN